MQKITPCLWFDQQAEEAVDFYVSVFRDARKGISVAGPDGELMTLTFTLFGTEYLALNGGPRFTFNEAVSFIISCDTQEEIDFYWNTLIQNGGEESMCGWLKDRFGLWWQVVPAKISQLMTGEPERVQRVMQAMMQMRKLDLRMLEKAYGA